MMLRSRTGAGLSSWRNAPMSSGPLRPAGYVAALDGLRGIAILAVVFHNTVEAVAGSGDRLSHYLLALAGPGWIGVQLFFVLSGFLIAGELLDNRTARNYLQAFYARRALRILPLYYSTLVLVLVAAWLIGAAPVVHDLTGDAWRLWLFLNNYGREAPSGFEHFWSLAVEAQFYALAPWVVSRTRAPRLLAVCICTAVAVVLFRTLCALMGSAAWTLYSGTVFRLDALALGAAGACLVRIESTAAILPRHGTAAVAVASLMLLCGAYLTHSYDFSTLACESYGYPLLAIAGALVVGAVGAPPAAGEQRQLRWGQWLSVLPLRVIGRYSFGIYVFHGLLNKLVGVPLVRHLLPAPIAGGAVAAYAATVFVVSLVLAALSYEFFESAFLRLKPRFRC
jgi:peptidoglycan/LPS O-acetylase OafA/YrhL